MYQNPYMVSLNQQNINDRIDNEIERLKQMKTQIQQPTPITQNFQLAPTHTGIKYANTIKKKKKEMIYYETPFFTKDLSVMWLKNAKGDIKTYELNEIVQKDEKDIQIELLQTQINELRKEMRKNEQPNTNDIATENTTNTEWYDETTGKPIKESEPTSVQRVSTSKKR